jgi:hypothetical protein
VCGSGEWSGIRIVSIASVPKQIDEVTTASGDLNKCSMSVKWTTPDDGGSAITGYRVEV